MNKIWQIVKAEFKIEFAYPLTWVFFLVLPIIFTLVIGVALGGSNQDNPDDQDVDQRPVLMIVDQDQSVLSEKLAEYLTNGDSIKVILLEDPSELTDEQRAAAQGYLTIPVGYEEALFENTPFVLSLDVASESFTSIAIENAIRTAITHTSGALLALRSSLIILEEGSSENSFNQQEYFSQQFDRAQVHLEEQPMYNLVVHSFEVEESSSDNMMGFNQSSAGQLVTWSMITLLGGSIIFVRDRQEGSYQRMFTTPTRKSIYFIGKVLSRLLMGLIQMVILVFFGMFILKVNWGNDPFLLIVFLACFSFAGTSFGLMLGAFCKTVKQADNLTTLLSMLLSALGGAWWPLEITPISYQNLVRVIPTTWAMLGFNDIIIKGQGFTGVLFEGGILLCFGVLFSGIGILKLKKME